MTIQAYEVNFDSLIGMTHLPLETSNPRLAAMQGLNKAKLLASLGIKQAFFPPQERPHLPTLNRIGFEGTTRDILSSAKKTWPWILPLVSYSPKAANAATISPSIDSADSHLHFTPANLASHFHRSMEAETMGRILRAIFPNPIYFAPHKPLPSEELFFDLGAANHTRFCKSYGSPGVQLFTYGKVSYDPERDFPKPKKQPACQTKEASETCARLHRLYPGHSLFACQNPSSIDEGVFQNDLVAMGNQNLLLIHEKALWKQNEILELLKQTVSNICNTELIVIEVKEAEIPLKIALSTYFFNSQLITLNDGTMNLIAQEQCKESDPIQQFLKNLFTDNSNPITGVHYVDLSEEGPASLRLRIVLNETELAETNPAVFFSEKLYQELSSHIQRYYPERLTLSDLSNPDLYQRSCESLDAISKILNLGAIYSFQH